jgi:hypothetical protein
MLVFSKKFMSACVRGQGGALSIGQAPEGFSQRHLFLVLRFDRRKALLPCTRHSPHFVDGEQGELARIVDRSSELDQFCGHGGVGSAQAVDLFAIMQRLRGQDLPLRLGANERSFWP